MINPILNLLPLGPASDTIRSFCLNHEKCEECELFGLKGKGCYFNNSVPCHWDLSSIISVKTEEAEKHKGRPKRRKKEVQNENCSDRSLLS